MIFKLLGSNMNDNSVIVITPPLKLITLEIISFLRIFLFLYYNFYFPSFWLDLMFQLSWDEFQITYKFVLHHFLTVAQFSIVSCLAWKASATFKITLMEFLFGFFFEILVKIGLFLSFVKFSIKHIEIFLKFPEFR
jgi:hypothetical protein